MNPNHVVTRFAPSPTGYLHIGGVRTTLFNYLFSAKNKGKLLLRIEDTDKERSKPEYTKNIFDSFAWLGMPFDDKPVIQSERVGRHQELLKQMIDTGKAYVSKETPTEPGGRTEVIRFKNPNKKVTFNDLIRGDISFDTTELGDFVIAKSLTEPLYHLAVVIDDFDMGITHVIRGEDHISNTPRQILIQEAIGAPQPIYAHLPMILAEDRSKLSKRKHGARVSMPYYQEEGFLPEAILNYLALLGWNPGTDRELFSLAELVEAFDLSRVQKSGAVFNEEKLRWINKEYIKKLSSDEFLKRITPYITEAYQTASSEQIQKLAPLILERISTFGDLKKMIADGELSYFFNEPQFDLSGLLWKGKGDLAITKTHLEKVKELAAAVPAENFNRDTFKAAIWPYAEQVGRGDVLWPTRFSFSGKDRSPDPFILGELLGQTETINRLTKAIERITNA